MAAAATARPDNGMEAGTPRTALPAVPISPKFPGKEMLRADSSIDGTDLMACLEQCSGDGFALRSGGTVSEYEHVEPPGLTSRLKFAS